MIFGCVWVLVSVFGKEGRQHHTLTNAKHELDNNEIDCFVFALALHEPARGRDEQKKGEKDEENKHLFDINKTKLEIVCSCWLY